MMSRLIAVVEDEVAIRENYVAALRRAGYQVEGYGGRAEAWRAFAQRLPDLVIIDVGLGSEVEGGFDLCRDLRAQNPTLPIIFLTARDNELDEISGLRLGADDYLTKDLSLAQLQVRVATLFRRVDALSRGPEPEQAYRTGELTLDQDRMRTEWRDHEIKLTVTEFWLVWELARRPEYVKTRGQLMAAANILVDDATITSHVKRIRHKFKQTDPDFDAIEAVFGIGYRWAG